MNLVKRDLNLDEKKSSCDKILNIVDNYKIKEKAYFYKKEPTVIEKLNFYYNGIKSKIFFLLVVTKILKRNIDKFYLTSKIPNGITKKEAFRYLKKIDNLDKKVKSNLKINQVSENLIKIEVNK